LQDSETLCRKGGTSRSDNAPRASGACAGAKLACGATLSATREFGLRLRGCSKVLTTAETPIKFAERNRCRLAPKSRAPHLIHNFLLDFMRLAAIFGNSYVHNFQVFVHHNEIFF
jgi:hypothetical protein